MQYSIKYYLSTKSLCKSLGMSETDMLEQRDANEFVKLILDKMEIYCKETKDEKSLD